MILDVGCGDGRFIRSLIEADIKAMFFATDITHQMIEIAKDELPDNVDRDVQLFVADAFRLPMQSDVRFKIIHMDSVLHHLIGNTRAKSKILIQKLVEVLVNKLTYDGCLIIEEFYYISSLFPTLTSFLVFYGLKMINFLKLDLSNYSREIRPGLEVNFLTPNQVKEVLTLYGRTILLQKKPTEIPKSYRAFLLKECGFITHVLEKSNKDNY
jgi:SAM-dependent methyltransferase